MPFFELGEGNPRHPDQLGELTPPRDGFRGIAAMLERVRVAGGSAAAHRVDRPGFRYVLIAHSSAAFRASRTASLFLIAAISLRILCNSLWDFLLSKYSEPSGAVMSRSNWLLRTLR